MKLLAPVSEERAVGDVLREGVLEGVLGLREHARLVDQLQRDELSQGRLGTRLDQAVEQMTAELPPDHRGGLERALRPIRKPVDPRGNDVLDRVGDEEIGKRLGQYPVIAFLSNA